MRFVVYGAGSIGGVAGGRLAQHGVNVALIARGRHYEAIRDRGLRVESPADAVQLSIPVFDHPSTIRWTPDDVVVLAVKSQDSAAALEALAACAPAAVPIVCLQNGVANERMALRRFANVYAGYVWCPAAHLSPGVVQAFYAPKTGIFDIGRFPSGVDEVARTVAAAFQRATFYSEPRSDVMRWKYRKLLSNLGNAVEALCGSAARHSVVLQQARREGDACLAAAGIAVAGDDEETEGREKTLKPQPIGDQKRPGGSSWQSLARGTRSIECDYLNGEIVLIGRLHGVPTPANELLQRLARQAAEMGTPPGSMSIEQLDAMLTATEASRPR